MITMLHYPEKNKNFQVTIPAITKIVKLIVMLVFFLSCFIAKAQFTKLHDFTGAITDGNNPQGALFYDGTNLYGTTALGGANSLGVLFSISPTGSNYYNMINFGGVLAKGTKPHGAVILVGDTLYGMTQYGGTNNKGTIFKILPNGTGYDTLLNLNGAGSGTAPFGSLLYDGTYLYATPQIGGSNNSGTLIKIKLDGSGYKKLLDMKSAYSNASRPEGTLVSDGTWLYGVGYDGGLNNKGSVFKVHPDSTGYTDLHSFIGTGGSGNYLTSGVILVGNILYGIAQSGGTSGLGVMYKVDPNTMQYDTLINFRGVSNGAFPHSAPYFDGTFLYGTTFGGGIHHGNGTLFRIKPNGQGYLKLLDFDSLPNGKSPMGDLISDGTYLYGTAGQGGTNNNGTVFKYQYCTPPAVTANASAASVCAGTTVTLTGGGTMSYTWTGGVTNGVAFVPAVTTTYTVTGRDTLTGCKNTAVKTITVNALPVVNLSATSNTLCINNSPTSLTGSPSGGAYSGTGVSASSFDPSVSGVGTFTLSYNYTDINNCSGTATTVMVVNGCAGINQAAGKINSVKIYPNPINNNFTIEGQTELGLITIYNSLGEIIYKEKTTHTQQQIDISKQAAGIYFLQSQNSFIKIIKE